jgi:uncharacterized damage-inducible protein DinB
MKKTILIHQLEDTLKTTLTFYDLNEIDLQKTYGEGKWSIRQILVHLADAESVLHERIKRTIAEPKQVLWAFNQDLWCQNLNYETFPLALSKALFIANRNAILYLADTFYDTLGHKEFIHSETGLRTLKDEFEKVVWHNKGHIEQIMTALEV